MQEKILKLCRRLKKCSFDDVVQFTGFDENEVQNALDNLVSNDDLIFSGGVYSFYPETELREKRTKNISLMQQFHSDADLEIILKGFCLEIPIGKLKHFVKCQENCICKFHQLFRQKIYERQLEILLGNYSKSPKVARIGTFFEKQAFFYFYDGQVFVSDKPLRADKEKPLTKQEIIEYKKVYSFLKRVENHNINENYIYHRIAEMIWRRNKSFEELYFDLNSLIY